MTKSRKKLAPTDWLADSTLPIYLVDDERRIGFVNAALAEWVGLPTEQILGAKLAYQSSSVGKSGALLGLAPPPNVTLKRQGLISVIAGDGRIRHRDAEFIPLADSSTDDSPLLVIVATVDKTATELAEATRRISPAEARHHQLLQWRRSEAATTDGDILAGKSLAILQTQRQVAAAIASRAACLLSGTCGSDIATVARLIHHGRGQSVGDPTRSLLVAEARLVTPGEFTTLLSTAQRQSTPTTLLVEHLEQLDDSLQEQLAIALAALPRNVQPIGTLIRAATTDTELQTSLRTRFATIEIDLPTLADRGEDLPLLAQAVVEERNAASNLQLAGLSGGANDLLALYDWPGGFAEFRQAIASACKTARGTLVEAGDLPTSLHHARELAAGRRQSHVPISIDKTMQQVERWFVERAIEMAGGNKAEAARLLEISRPRLYRLLESFGMLTPHDDAPEFIEEGEP